MLGEVKGGSGTKDSPGQGQRMSLKRVLRWGLRQKESCLEACVKIDQNKDTNKAKALKGLSGEDVRLEFNSENEERI